MILPQCRMNVQFDRCSKLALSYALALSIVGGGMMLPYCAIAQSTLEPTPAAKGGQEDSAPTTTTVTVKGQRTAVQDRIDRRVYNVKDDPDAQTGVIADVLGKLPSVQVSPSGVISLRGDSHVFIMIDGKYPANGNAAAQSLSAADVDRIEIMTNPSAQFAPEGTAGIINIITKKRHPFGLRGALNARLNTLGQSNLAPSFTLTTGKWSLDGRLRYGHVPTTSTLETATNQPVTSYQVDHYSGPEDTYVGALNGSYKATDHSTFTLQSQLYRNDNKNLDEGYYQSPDLSFSKFSPISNHVAQSDLELIYEYQNEETGTHVTLDADHTRAQEAQKISETDTYPDASSDVYRTENTTKGVEDNLKADLEQRFQNGGLLTSGLQWDRHQNDLMRNFGGSSVGLTDIALEQYDHNFSVDQALSSAYLTYQWPIGPWTVLPGIRAEYELRNMQYGVENFHSSDLRWYPSLHLQRDLANHKKIKMSYSRRIQRPELSDYDPGIANINVNGQYVGNPYLKPMDTDSFEVEYGYNNEETNYQASLYYRSNSDLLTEITTARADGFLTTMPVNAGTSHSAGVEVTLKAPIKVGWKYSANLNLGQTQLNRIGQGQREYFSYTGNGELDYDTESGDEFSANLVLTGRSYSVQGYTKATYRVDLTYQHPIAPRLTLVAAITDLTNSQSETIVIDTPDLRNISYRRPYSQSFRLGISWKFGGKK